MVSCRCCLPSSHWLLTWPPCFQLPGTKSAWQERAWCNPCRAWALVLPSDGWGVFCEASPQLRPLPRMDDFLPLEMGDFWGMCSFGGWYDDLENHGQKQHQISPSNMWNNIGNKNVINNQEHDLLVPRPRGIYLQLLSINGKMWFEAIGRGTSADSMGNLPLSGTVAPHPATMRLTSRHQHAHVWPHRADPRDHGGGMARLCLNTRRKNSEMGNRVVAFRYVY